MRFDGLLMKASVGPATMRFHEEQAEKKLEENRLRFLHDEAGVGRLMRNGSFEARRIDGVE